MRLAPHLIKTLIKTTKYGLTIATLCLAGTLFLKKSTLLNNFQEKNTQTTLFYKTRKKDFNFEDLNLENLPFEVKVRKSKFQRKPVIIVPNWVTKTIPIFKFGKEYFSQTKTDSQNNQDEKLANSLKKLSRKKSNVKLENSYLDFFDFEGYSRSDENDQNY